MKILVCAAAAPLPPTTGFTLVLDALLQEFRRRNEIQVIAYRLPNQSGSPAADVRLIPARHGGAMEMAAAIVRRRPRYAGRLAPGMRAAVKAGIEEFRPDAVVVFSGRLAELGRDLQHRPTVLVTLDAVHLGTQTRLRGTRGIRRFFHQVEERRVRRFEAEEFSRFHRVVVVSDRDRDALEGLNSKLRVEVIPNGVDAEFYAPDLGIAVDPLRIVFTGVMSSPANVVAAEFAAREILPQVRSQVPGARLTLVGRAPAPRVRALAAIEGVDVTGEVPDIRPWLIGSRTFLCPMISGTGIKNKMLEAMASGLACVTTPLGLGGLEVEDGRELLVGDTAESLADRLVQLLRDDDLAARLGRTARAYVLARHSWTATAQRYEALLAQVCDEHVGDSRSGASS